MAIDFSVNTFSAQQNISHTAHSPSSAATGALMGQTVKVVASPLSLLASAAEELTFAVDTTDEFELEERKEKRKMEDALLERLELYKDMMHKAGKSEELDNFKKDLRTGDVKNGALKEASQRFPDPTDAWAALTGALKDLEKDMDCPKAILDDIRSAINELEQGKGSEIKAGIFGATTALDFKDLASGDELRDLYRQNVCEFNDASIVFKHIQENYGSLSFNKAMEFLFSSLSADIASDLPSMEKVHLEHVHANLGQVRLLQSTHTLCENLLGRWEKVHNQVNCPLKSMELLGDMVALGKERFLGALQINQIANKAKPVDIEHEVLFLQELMTTTRSIPPRLYDGDQGFIKVMDAVQQSVDNAIMREDDYLASLE